MANRVYISGLWLNERNVKRDANHYYTFLEKTLEIIAGEKLFFFTSDHKVRTCVEKACKSHKIELTLKEKNKNDLERYWKPSQDIQYLNLEAFQDLWDNRRVTREKSFEHFFIDSKNLKDIETLDWMRTIWLSKVYLVDEVLEELSIDEYCWIDASVSRFNGIRESWDFSKKMLNEKKIHHYSSPMNFFGRTIPINASVLMGPREAWVKFISDYKIRLASLAKTNYIYDEEIVIALCHQNNMDLFECINESPRNVGHKILGRLIFPINGLLLKAMNYNSKL